MKVRSRLAEQILREGDLARKFDFMLGSLERGIADVKKAEPAADEHPNEATPILHRLAGLNVDFHAHVLEPISRLGEALLEDGEVCPNLGDPDDWVVESVEDTRERDFDTGKPIPGSGMVRNCQRCSKAHEIHALIRNKKTGQTMVTGTGCMVKAGVKIPDRLVVQAKKEADARAKEKALEKLDALIAGRVESFPDWFHKNASEIWDTTVNNYKKFNIYNRDKDSRDREATLRNYFIGQVHAGYAAYLKSLFTELRVPVRFEYEFYEKVRDLSKGAASHSAVQRAAEQYFGTPGHSWVDLERRVREG